MEYSGKTLADAIAAALGGNYVPDPFWEPKEDEGDHGYYWLGERPGDEWVRSRTVGMPEELAGCPVGNGWSSTVLNGSSAWVDVPLPEQDAVAWPIALHFNRDRGLTPFSDSHGKRKGWVVAEQAEVTDEIEMLEAVEDAKAARYGSAEGIMATLVGKPLLIVTGVGEAEPWKAAWKTWYRVLTGRRKGGRPTVLLGEGPAERWAMAFEEKVGLSRANRLQKIVGTFMHS